MRIELTVLHVAGLATICQFYEAAREKIVLRLCFIELIEVKNIFLSGNQIQTKELTAGIIEYLKQLAIHSRTTNKYAWPGNFLVFSAFLVLVSFSVYLHNLHMGLTIP